MSALANKTSVVWISWLNSLVTPAKPPGSYIIWGHEYPEVWWAVSCGLLRLAVLSESKIWPQPLYNLEYCAVRSSHGNIPYTTLTSPEQSCVNAHQRLRPGASGFFELLIASI